MRFTWTRLVLGQTRYGLFTNLDHAGDRRTMGVWYVCLHCAPFYFELTGKARP